MRTPHAAQNRASSRFTSPQVMQRRPTAPPSSTGVPLAAWVVAGPGQPVPAWTAGGTEEVVVTRAPQTRHGLVPETPEAAVGDLVAFVHDESAKGR